MQVMNSPRLRVAALLGAVGTLLGGASPECWVSLGSSSWARSCENDVAVLHLPEKWSGWERFCTVISVTFMFQAQQVGGGS